MLVGFPNVTSCDGDELIKSSWYTSSVSSAVLSSVILKSGRATETWPAWNITCEFTSLPDIITDGGCVPGPEYICNRTNTI